MSSPKAEELGPLIRAFCGADPDASLAAGLAELERFGIVGDEHASDPWLALERGDKRLTLVARDAVDPAVRDLISCLIGAAFARAAETAAHRLTRERLDMLSQASFEGILVHVNGVVIDANERLAEILRGDREALLGPDTLRTSVAPEDMPGVLARMASGFEGAYVITGVRKDGTRFRAELQSKQGRLGERPVRFVAVRDVSERERTLALLEESERRLRELAEAAFDLTTYSRDGVVVEVTGRLMELLGYTRDEVVGKKLSDFVAPSSLPMLEKVIAERRSGAYESVILSKSGEPVPVEIVGIYSTLDGVPTRVAGLRDIRKARAAEDDRRRLQHQLERTQRLDSLGVLAGGIAHDFNNLLVGVLGNADLLLETTSDPNTRETLEAIVAAGQEAASLTRQMLAYAGRAGIGPPRPVDIAELLRELRVLLSASLSKKATLSVNVESGSLVMAERTTLTQVLINLLTNASDALGGKSGRIDVRACPVSEPDARWDDALGATVGPGSWVLVEVEDNGIGMDQRTLARIFEPFFTTKTAGHGLGLAACLGIVSAQGGALLVDSVPGSGSTFSLLLPAAGQVSKREPSAPPLTTAPCRVLVVDDEPVVRAQIRRSLELRGFSVFEADDGRSGLAWLESQNADVVLLDMAMPELDGAEVVRELRRRGSSVPVVLSSGYVDAATERRLEPGSFQAFLRKPYGVAELLDAITRARSLEPGAEARLLDSQ